jgi:hypothetical protein
MQAINRQGANEKEARDRERELRQLKAKLVLLGVPQRKVAQETKVSFGYVCHILAGRRYNKTVIDYIERLA